MMNNQSPEDKMVATLERIARDLERLLTGTYVCGGLLGLIAFLMLFKLMIGR